MRPSDGVTAGVAGRARVSELAKSDPDAALRVARSIEHPWYRCQALATAAAVQPDPIAARALDAAVAAAHELPEPNRIVTAAGWPLHVCVQRKLGNPAAEVKRLLAVIAAEPHSLRRAHALFALLEAVFADRALRSQVLVELLAALARSHGWRAERTWSFLVLLMLGESRDAAQWIYDAMPEGRAKRNVGRQLASPPHQGPRWIDYPGS